jgi:hypothetical protein
MATLKMGSIASNNKGIFIHSFLVPFIKTKTTKATGTKLVAPTFNKDNYDKQAKLRIMLSERKPKTQAEAETIYKEIFKKALEANNKPTGGIDELIDAELTRIKANYGGTLNTITKILQRKEGEGGNDNWVFYSNLMSGRQGHTDYERTIKLALEESSKGEAKTAREAQKAGAGVALASRQMIRQTSAEVLKKTTELAEVQQQLAEAKKREGVGLSMTDIQKIAEDAFINEGDDFFGEGEDEFPYYAENNKKTNKRGTNRINKVPQHTNRTPNTIRRE